MKGNVYIPKPCHENWNKMTEAEKGRHCEVCSKVVTDFTKMKTEEIVATLQNSNDNVCGRMNINQLTPVSKQQKLYFWFRGTFIPKVGYAMFAILGLASLYRKSAYSQSLPGGLKVTGVSGDRTSQPQSTEKLKINIEVVNEFNKAVNNANVRIISHNTELSSSQTNIEGKTSAIIEMEQVGQSFITVEVSAKGYEVKQMKDIRIAKDNQTIRIKLDENVLMMGKVSYHEQPEKEIIKIDSLKKARPDDLLGRDEPVYIEKENIVLVQTEPTLSIVEIGPYIWESQNDVNQFIGSSFVIQNHAENLFISFPNPTLADVTIETKLEESFDIKIYNEAGLLLLQETNQYKRAMVSLHGNPAATYFAIIFINNKAVETHKIILVK